MAGNIAQCCTRTNVDHETKIKSNRDKKNDPNASKKVLHTAMPEDHE